MATYSYNGPTSGTFPTEKDEVRFKLGDTNPSAPFSLSDEEIEYLLAQPDATVVSAAAQAASRMAVFYTREAGVQQKSVGNLSLSLSYSDQAAAYRALASELRSGADLNSMAAGPVWNTDYTTPQFTLGQFDNRGL